MQELLKAEILKSSQKYASPIWSQLCIALFGEDTPQNRHWLWLIWTYNRKGVRDQLHRAMASSTLSTTSEPKLLESGDQMENEGRLSFVHTMIIY